MRWAVVVAAENVADGVAVGNHISLESPGTAKKTLQQELVGAGRLAIDRVVGAHHRPGMTLDDSSTKRGRVGVQFIMLDVHVRRSGEWALGCCAQQNVLEWK